MQDNFECRLCTDICFLGPVRFTQLFIFKSFFFLLKAFKNSQYQALDRLLQAESGRIQHQAHDQCLAFSMNNSGQRLINSSLLLAGIPPSIMLMNSSLAGIIPSIVLIIDYQPLTEIGIIPASGARTAPSLQLEHQHQAHEQLLQPLA